MTYNRTPLRVLVVDDSALYRKIVRDVLQSAPDVEVVGTAANGMLALSQIASLKPDVITLDFEMPKLDGIGVLKKIAGQPNAPAAIMVSAFTASGAAATTSALQEGAFDFILKPNTKSLDESVEQLRRDLLPKLQACRTRSATKKAQRLPTAAPARQSVAAAPRRVATATRSSFPARKPEILGIAVSTGGPQALSQLLPKLPADFPCPIVMVQHMPPMFTASLAADLDRRCKLQVDEGSDGMLLKKGQIVIAPGGKQMRLASASGGARIEITNDPPERNCKPAADYLFRSIASIYGAKSLGVVLTGMGDDGTLGAQAIKKAGGTIIAQDEQSCVVYGMPKSIVENGLADCVAPLDQISARLADVTQGRVLV
ncbi:MAG: chemotaxis response regulator protein-glutamate methylesterase [Planctomycetota bacterium]